MQVPTRWLSPDEQRAWRAFINGSQQLQDHMNQQLSDDDNLTLAEYRILALLSEAPDRSLRMSDLADGVLSSRSRLTHQIRRMERDGLVRRDNCLDDGRGVLAVLTDEGLRRVTAVAPTHVTDVRQHFIDLMTPEELAVVTAVFERVQGALR